MSANGQIHSPGPNDWVEQLRVSLRQDPPPVSDAILDAAYDACEIETATLFDYCEGRLSEEERQEVEAEILASPRGLEKLARVGAIVAQNRMADGTPTPTAAAREQNYETSTAPTTSQAAQPAASRARLGQPRASLGSSQPRREDCTPLPPDGDCEVYRSLEKTGDQLRIYHQTAPVGTLLRIRLVEPQTGTSSPSEDYPRFVVLRRGSESSTAGILTIPMSLKRRELDLELAVVPPHALSSEDAAAIASSFEKAAQQDPIAVTPLHEPRSAWQIWAEEAVRQPHLPPAVREVAELIATS